MRIKFYISTYDPNRWGDDCVSNEPSGHNSYTQLRHKHERYTFKEMLREEFRPYCIDSYHQEPKSFLIDIPDDIGFQFMMQGIMDGDYLAYNLYTEKYAFSNSVGLADDATYNDGSSVQGVAWGGNMHSGHPMIQWGIEEKPTSTRKDITIPVEDEFYTNLHEYCKPIIEHWAYTKYFQICADLNTVLLEKEESIFTPITSYENIPEDIANSERKPGTFISMDCLNFLFFDYINDGEMYTASKEHLHAHQIEFYRRMYVYMHRISTEAV